MSIKQTLSGAIACALALNFNAFANVVYDSETTNEWFHVDMSSLTTEALQNSPWTPPSTDGEAVVQDKVIKLDTDFGNPLTYAPQGGDSTNVAIVAVEMTAAVNVSAPDLSPVPQAALCVIGTETATNWVGLVGADNENGYKWETFATSAPVAGETYSVRIEFDQRQGQRKIRYRVGDTVLGTGWYSNPKTTDVTNIKSISFSGVGDVSGLGGSNVVENASAEIAIEIDNDTAGYDFTNGTINVNTTVKSGASGKLTLTVVDFDGKVRAAVEKTVTDATHEVAFDLDDLTAGGTYSYTIAVSNAGGEDLCTAYGEFTAANWGDDVWFGADAAKEQRVVGGVWETEPAISNHVYVIEENSVFNVAEDKQDQGSNRVTRVDAKVMFESLVDGDMDVPESGALGGFVATTEGWKALTAGAWVTLTGGSLPVAGTPYVIRAEVDFLSATKRVRYLVSEDDGETFIPLSNGSAQWIDLVVQDKSLLAKVELQGSGKVAMFEARVADKALAKVGDVEYDTMEEALAAAGTNGEYQITLLTNATIEPTEKGKYEIAPGAYHYVSGGKVSSGNRTIIIDDPTKPPVVRPTDTEMKKVMTPDGKSYKDYDSLRKFLEKNKVEGYTKDDADATSVSNALETTGANSLKLWQDYALGVDKDTPVAPVTKPTGDTAADGITLAIPAVDPAKYSGDYDISYQINDKPAEGAPQIIKVPLETGTYSIKAVFTPKN